MHISDITQSQHKLTTQKHINSHKSGQGNPCIPEVGIEGMQLITVAANGEIQLALSALGKLLKSTLDTPLLK